MRLIFLRISTLLVGPILCLAAESSTENPISYNSSDLIAQAYEGSSREPCMAQQRPVCGQDQRIQIGGNYTYCWITPEGNSTVSGNLGGAQGIYEYRPLQSVYAGAAFSYRIGKTSNDIGTRELQDFNPQARVGYTFCKTDIADHLSLFTGFGARYMAETVTVGSASLDFDYTTLYIPLGFLLERTVTKHFLIGCNFQWMPQVLPMVRISPLDGAQWDLTYQLLNFFVEVPFTFSACGKGYAISICPFLETWRDGESTAKTLTHLTLSLPGNRYIFTGLNVNFSFSY